MKWQRAAKHDEKEIAQFNAVITSVREFLPTATVSFSALENDDDLLARLTFGLAHLAIEMKSKQAKRVQEALTSLATFCYVWIGKRTGDQSRVDELIWKELKRQHNYRIYFRSRNGCSFDSPDTDARVKFRFLFAEAGYLASLISAVETSDTDTVKQNRQLTDKIIDFTAIVVAWLESLTEEPTA